jgi:hypothetical protein
MNSYTLAQKAKAVAAFVGALVTGALSVLAGTGVLDQEVGGVNVGYFLSGVAAVCTYVAAFRIPNAPTEDGAEPADVEIEGTH